MELNWRTQRLFARLGPWAMFIATVSLGITLYVNGGNRGRLVGFAQGEKSAVASMDAGKVALILVDVGQEVSLGQEVARLDSSAIDSEIAVMEAERGRLKAQLEATLAATERLQDQDARTLDQSVEQVKLNLAREQAEYDAARAEEQALRGERKRLRKLVSGGLATADDLVGLDVRYARLKQDVAEYPKRIQLLREQFEAAEKRREQYTAPSPNVEGEPIERELEVVAKRLDRLRERKQALSLRAASAGRVTGIGKRPGEVVSSGEPVINMISTRAARVVACVSEQDALSVQVGDDATLWLRGARNEPLQGRAIALGPLVDEVPVRCRRVPTQPAWGRDVIIQLSDNVELVPGQAFDVRFMRPQLESGTAIANTALHPKVLPRPIAVPDALSELSRFEPSGLVWQPALSRYLVVSDDTGTRSKKEHAPWLFTMSMDGALDPQPMVVSGVENFNDLEAIATVDPGETYVLSSQAFSRKGKRAIARTHFLRLKRKGTEFKAAGGVQLVELLEAAPAQLRESLGLQKESMGSLDVEGLASREGALYLGVKAPLDADGNALIWRIDEPRELMRTGRLEDGKISLFGRVKLVAEADGQVVPGGISELLFLPDGRLIITSTSSRVDGDVMSGRLWSLTEPTGGLMQAESVRRFPGLQPEGLSLSPTPGNLVVAFDAGDETPSWLEMPWPK